MCFALLYSIYLVAQGDMRAKNEMRARNVAGNSAYMCVCVHVFLYRDEQFFAKLWLEHRTAY